MEGIIRIYGTRDKALEELVHYYHQYITVPRIGKEGGVTERDSQGRVVLQSGLFDENVFGPYGDEGPEGLEPENLYPQGYRPPGASVSKTKSRQRVKPSNSFNKLFLKGDEGPEGIDPEYLYPQGYRPPGASVSAPRRDEDDFDAMDLDDDLSALKGGKKTKKSNKTKKSKKSNKTKKSKKSKTTNKTNKTKKIS